MLRLPVKLMVKVACLLSLLFLTSSTAFAQQRRVFEDEVWKMAPVGSIAITPSYFSARNGDWGYGGSAGLNLILDVFHSDLERGLEYRGASARSITAYIDYRYFPFWSSKNSFGPYIGAGLAAGIAGEHAWQEALELRGAAGFNVPLLSNIGVGVSAQYRLGLENFFADPTFKGSYGGALNVNFYLGR